MAWSPLQSSFVSILVLLSIASLFFYYFSRMETPPLWWPNFMRPGWDRDVDAFTDVEVAARTEAAVMGGGLRFDAGFEDEQAQINPKSDKYR